MAALADATLEGPGLVVARLLGIAIMALALTWLSTRDLDLRFRRIDLGFISYNLGVGLLFLLYAIAAIRPVPLAWVVALVHLFAGFGYSVAVLIRRRPAGSDNERPTIGAA